MKTIYIDTLICVNLFIDFLILSVIKSILHINTKNKRVLFAALLGATSTLIILLPIRSIFLSAIYKISTAIVIIITAFGKATFRNFIIRMLTYLGISMILSTAVLSVNLMWKPVGVYIYNNTLYFDISPTILLLTTGIMYLILNIYHRVTSEHKLDTEVHKITLSVDKTQKVTFESAIDTGCNLREPFSGLPVILTEKEILSDINLSNNKMRIIPYSTISGDDTIFAFKPKYIDIDGKVIHNSCYVALCNGKLKGEIKSIMGPELMEAL